MDQPPIDTKFNPLQIMNSISAITLLEELKHGHNTFALLMVTIEGRIVYANDIAVNGFRGQTVDSIQGKLMHDLLPKEWADERLAVFQRAIQVQRPIHFYEIINGVRLYTRIAAIQAVINNAPADILLVTVEPIIAPNSEWLLRNKHKEDVIVANCVDLGKLNVLSGRELEVLALMGQGMRQKDIAKELSRSVSAINRHRESIGAKLQMTDRAQIVHLANLAILEVSDASRMRFDLNPDSPANIDL